MSAESEESMRLIPTLRPLLLAALVAAPLAARAEIFAGVDFPQGASSFADAVVLYSPNILNGQPIASVRDPAEAIGAPDFVGDSNYVTLGDGGSLTLAFNDNKLTGSGSNSLDLWIFEIGGDVEDTFVEISKDGLLWTAVGKVFGATSGIDIDAFGFGVNDLFGFVRLTDDTNEGQQTGSTVGADIDAVGAITSISTPPVPAIPEPSTYALMAIGLGAVAWASRRRSGAAQLSA
jgi:PEP-CTERM motif